jgi:uncharacterized protein
MHRDAATLTLLGIIAASLCAAAASVGSGETFQQYMDRWRRQREADLKADDGWLTVCGLSWLRPGETRIGSDPGNDVLLPAHAPAFVGMLTLKADRVSFRAATGVVVTRNGQPFESGEVRSDADEHPDILAVGDVKILLLRRGHRQALRIKDNRSPIRAGFAGLRWYPASEQWQITAKFVAYPTPVKLTMDTIVGEQDIVDSPGYVTFDREGKSYRLQAARAKGGALWFVFRDGTSGRTTAGGARQLTADPARGDEVTLDFNKAVNLPCAYIPYATCPLAPPQNRLSLAIEAGEKTYEPAKPADTAGR